MSRLRISKFLVIAALVVGGFAALRAGDDVPPTELEENPAPLAPKRARSESENDRLIAVARYAHGRILLHRGDRDAALKVFQRAFRYDPSSISIVREIVPLASSLERPEEAARYAVLTAERHPTDAERMRQLGAMLIKQNDLPRAVRMFEAVVELEKDEPPIMATVSLRMEMGRLYFVLGEFPKAAGAFAYVRDALKAPGKFGLTTSQRDRLLTKSALLYPVIGETFLLTDRMTDAVEAFQKAHQAFPDEAMLAFQLARVHARKKEWKPARERLDEYFQAKSSAAGQQPYELLRDVLVATAPDEKTAWKSLLQTLSHQQKEDPANSELAYFLAGRHLEAKQWSEAEVIYLDLLDTRPTPSAFQGLCEIYRQQEKADAFIDIVGRAVDRTGNLDVLGSQRAQLVKDAEWFGKLTSSLKERLETQPRSVRQDVLVAMALLAVSADAPETAEWFVQQAAEAKGDPKRDILEMIGLSMRLAGQSEPAARLLRQAIEEHPSPQEAAADYYYLAGALEMAGKTDEALKAAREAATLQPDSAPLQARVPWILYHAERFADAEREYLRFLQEFDSYYESGSVREVVREARIILSNICVMQDRIPEAEEWLEQVLDEFPENIAAFNDLGYLWADQSRHLERALGMVERAVQAEPDNVAYRDSLGWALFRLGQYQKAVRELEQASTEDAPDGVILDHLGDAYWMIKDRDKALSAWRRATEVFRGQKFRGQKETEYLERTEAKIRKHETE
ncbi:MAG: tetratricopeptide repeat protein [Pirellulaceae bacterium]